MLEDRAALGATAGGTAPLLPAASAPGARVDMLELRFGGVGGGGGGSGLEVGVPM